MIADAQELWAQELADSKSRYDVRQMLRDLDTLVRRANDPAAGYPDELLPRDLIREIISNVSTLCQERADLGARLDAVRAQRDAAVQQSLDHAATIAVLRRKLDGPRAERIGYCESTFTAPDGVGYVCALDAGHKANLHRDASLHYAWDDNAKTPGPVADAHGIEHNDMRDECADVEQCDECETVGQNCRTHAVADAHVDGVHTCGVATTTPRGNRVVCALHPGHGQHHHSAGGFRWTNEARP